MLVRVLCGHKFVVPEQITIELVKSFLSRKSISLVLICEEIIIEV